MAKSKGRNKKNRKNKKNTANLNTRENLDVQDALAPMVQSAQKDFGRFQDYAEQLENPSRILQKTSEGCSKGIDLFREMELDPQVGADLRTLKEMVKSFTWDVHAPSGEETDNEQAAQLEEQIRPIHEELMNELLDALLLGYSVTELEFVMDGRVELPGVLGHDQKKFGFSADGTLLMTVEGGKTTPVEPERVLVASYDKRKGNPYGRSILTNCFWYWYFKKHAVLYWSTYLEKFGQPTVVGEFPPGTPKEQQSKLLDAAQSIQNDMAVVVPQGWLLKLLEAKRGGSADTYEKFLKYLDRGISKTILLSVLTSNEAEHGALAMSQTHKALTDYAVGSLARWVADQLTDQLVKRLAVWDYSFQKPPVFRIHTQSEDTSKDAADRDNVLASTVPVAVDDIYKRFNLTTPDENTIVVLNGKIGKYGDFLKEGTSETAPPEEATGKEKAAEFALPATAGVPELIHDIVHFSKEDIDDMDRLVMAEQQYIDDVLGHNRRLLAETVDQKKLEKLLNNAGSYEKALIALDKYTSGKKGRKAWTQLLTLARLLGEHSVREQIKLAELEETAASFASPIEGMTQFEPGADFQILDADDAIAWFKKKTAVEKNIWRKLQGDSKSAAFYVSGLQDLTYINIAKDKMLKCLKDGITFETYKKELFQYSGAYPFHGNMYTAFHTNMLSALSVQNETALRRHTGRFRYWRYSAVMDGRTRDSHAAMHNFVARHDHPRWARWTPPNGFNCRCRKVICTDARYKELKEEWKRKREEYRNRPGKPMDIDAVQPDEGFHVNPMNADYKTFDSVLDILSKNSGRILELIYKEFKKMDEAGGRKYV